MTLNLSADDVLTTTRSVRKRLDFDKPVPREVLTECLDLALQAPTGSNHQGWPTHHLALLLLLLRTATARTMATTTLTRRTGAWTVAPTTGLQKSCATTAC